MASQAGTQLTFCWKWGKCLLWNMRWVRGKRRFYFSWIYDDRIKNTCFLWQDHEWFIYSVFVCFFFLHEYILPTDSRRQAKPHGWRLGLKVQGTGFRCIQWWGCTFKQLNTPRPTHSHIITWNLKKVNALYRAVVCLAVLGHCRNMADSLSVHRRLTLRSQKHNNFYFQAMTH